PNPRQTGALRAEHRRAMDQRYPRPAYGDSVPGPAPQWDRQDAPRRLDGRDQRQHRADHRPEAAIRRGIRPGAPLGLVLISLQALKDGPVSAPPFSNKEGLHMLDLVSKSIDAHGGLARWENVKKVSATLQPNG